MAAAFGLQAEEDPAAEFLAQQQHEIAGIENDEENLDLEARDQDEATAESQPSHLITDSFQGNTRGANPPASYISQV